MDHHAPLPHQIPPTPSRPPVVQRLLNPFAQFLSSSTSGGILILLATLAALVLANGPLRAAWDALLHATIGLRLGEMRGHHEHSFCCGAGGGHFWMDLDQGEGRTFNHRVDQAVEAGASVLAVGCSFCWQMLENGVKAKELEARIQVKDVASLVRAEL